MAATKIQNLWKGAIARRQVKKQREEELAFIGMVNLGDIIILNIIHVVIKHCYA